MRLARLTLLSLLFLSACVATPLHSPSDADADTNSSSLALFMPVDGLLVREVVNNFGASRGARWHEGIDLFAARGTPVRPAAAGIVSHVGETVLGGLSVTVLGHDGLRYFYTHLDSVPSRLAVGLRVAVRDVIGFVGNSGNASGGPTHLHFAVYAPTSDGRGWLAFDPTPHLVDRASPER